MIRSFQCKIALTVWLAISTLGAWGQVCDSPLTLTTKSPPSLSYKTVVFDGNSFLASDGTYLLLSQDGDSWTMLHPDWDLSSTPICTLIFGHGRYMAHLGDWCDDARHWIGRDATHWELNRLAPSLSPETLMSAGAYFFIQGVYADGIHLFLGVDGARWWGQEAPLSSGINSIAFDGQRYYAGTSDGRIGTSPDALNWTWGEPLIDASILQICTGEGTVLAATSWTSDQGEPAMLLSTDGSSWTRIPAPARPRRGLLAFGNGRFVMIADATSSLDPRGWVSVDGMSWSPFAAWPEEERWDESALAFGNGKFVAATTTGMILTSTDGLDWTEAGEGQGFRRIAKLASGGSPPRQVLAEDLYFSTRWWTSFDGLTWSEGQETEPVSDVTYGNGRFVALSAETIYASEDGLQWDGVFSIPYPYDYALKYLAFGDGRFVAAGEGGRILQSRDGLTWQGSLLPCDADYFRFCPEALALGGGKILAVAPVNVDNVIYVRPYVSEDGVDWVQGDADFAGGWNDIPLVVHRGRFYGLTYRGQAGHTFVSSADGLTWRSEDTVGQPGRFWDLDGQLLSEIWLAGVPGPLLGVYDDGGTWSLHRWSLPANMGGIAEESGDTYAWCSPYGGLIFRTTFDHCLPEVTGLSPSIGPSQGGTPVVLEGSGFAGATQVLFGASPAASFHVDSDFQITAVTPPHDSTGAGVTVGTPAGESMTSGLSTYDFTSPAPFFETYDVKWAGATGKLKLSGYGFRPGCSIDINGQPVPSFKIKKVGPYGTMAVISGGRALKAMLPKGRKVLITVRNADDPIPVSVCMFAR